MVRVASVAAVLAFTFLVSMAPSALAQSRSETDAGEQIADDDPDATLPLRRLPTFHYAFSDMMPDYMQKAVDEKYETARGMMTSKFDSVYPYYLKYCATTRYHPRQDGATGGAGGHALFYLKGACRDTSIGPSGLRLCDTTADYADPETGVGISVDKQLRNVNFFTIPGLKLFLSADLFGQHVFDHNVKDKIISHVLAKQIFSGIELHDQYYPNSLLPDHKQEFIARSVFGTDYGLSMARNLYCINIPLNRGVVGEVVDHLNRNNAAFTSSKGKPFRGLVISDEKDDNDYHWSWIYDNCTHLAINALQVIGVLEGKKINQTFFNQLVNIAVPANTFLDIFETVTDGLIDVNAVFDHPRKRQIFQQHRWIPEQDGLLVEYTQVHRHNTIYNTDDSILVLPGLLSNRAQRMREVGLQPEFRYNGSGFSGFIPNLIHAADRYRTGLELAKQAKSDDRYVKRLAKKRELPVVNKEIAFMNRTLKSSSITEGEMRSVKKDLAKLEKTRDDYTLAQEYVDFVDDFTSFLRESLDRLEVRMAEYDLQEEL